MKTEFSKEEIKWLKDTLSERFCKYEEFAIVASILRKLEEK